jgi:hypothetical protein
MGHGAETDWLYIKSGQKNGQPEVIVANSAIRFEAVVVWSIRENCSCDCPASHPGHAAQMDNAKRNSGFEVQIALQASIAHRAILVDCG